MTDTVVVEKEDSSSFVDSLGIPKRGGATMTTRYNAMAPADKRVAAVSCALELIKVSIANGNLLCNEIQQLGHYADLIQNALEE